MSEKESHVRNPDDFYGTPDWCVRAIATRFLPEFLSGTGMLVEPSAGDGAILKTMLALGVPAGRMVAVEKDPVRAAACNSLGVSVIEGDTLALTYANAGLVVMNPPYRQAREHVEHAIRQASPWGGTVVALLRLAFLGSKRRILFWQKYPADVLVLPERPSFTGDGRSDASEYAWFVWGPERGGRWKVLELDESCSPPKRRRQRQKALPIETKAEELPPPIDAATPTPEERAVDAVAEEAAAEPMPTLSPISAAVTGLLSAISPHEQALDAALASKDEWLAKQAARAGDDLPDFG